MKKYLFCMSFASLISGYSFANSQLICPAAKDIPITYDSSSQKYIVTSPVGYELHQIKDISKINHIGFFGAKILFNAVPAAPIDQFDCLYGQDSDQSANIADHVFTLSLKDTELKNQKYHVSGKNWYGDNSYGTVMPQIDNTRQFSCFSKGTTGYVYLYETSCSLEKAVD